jgi:hypothetical protein
MEREPVRPDHGSMPGRVLSEGKWVHIIDSQADPDPQFSNRARSGNVRSMLGVPLLRGAGHDLRRPGGDRSEENKGQAGQAQNKQLVRGCCTISWDQQRKAAEKRR